MIVKMKTNLGSHDARRCKLNFSDCTKGAEVECNADAGRWLVANGMAVEIVAVAKPAAIQAVPPPRAEFKNKPSNKDS